ncbi:timeless protein-domain-containing protein [Radiomyces spectabilis]|uniref:timeless protein-domain-containing protein n=1 Tax=Radiomyces spectabilis TaxID=64574 RepID=UPI002220108D|nr:timeless protein-domain-containing protein [Radiomyces spectabilis]KAI8375942.1 timeless protein-domain-containing protein [Radiomyces spectabilis]
MTTMEEPTNAEDQTFKNLILSTCTALGGMEEQEQADGTIVQVYSVGDEGLACLRDLKQFIRADSSNPEKIALHALAEFKIVQTDLIPIILRYADKLQTSPIDDKEREIAERFVLACVEVLVPLTWPVPTQIEQEEDNMGPNMLHYHRQYKLALMVPGVLEAVLSLLERPLSLPHRERSLRDQTIIRLVLYFLRNLAAIPDLNVSQIASDDLLEMSSLQETMLIRFCESKMMDLLLTLASQSTDDDLAEWNVMVLEIFYHLLQNITPKAVFATDLNVQPSAEIPRSSKKMALLMQQENEQKRLKARLGPSRHSRFGGAYTLQTLGDPTQVLLRQEGGYADLGSLMDERKKPDRRGKKRKEMDEISVHVAYHRAPALRYFKRTAQDFVKNCFNNFYHSIVRDIQREDKKIVEKDHMRFSFTMKWFLEYLLLEIAASKKSSQAPKRHKPNDEKGNDQELFLPRRNASSPTSHEEVGITPVPADADQIMEEPREEFDFDLIANIMDIRVFYLIIRRLRTSIDDKLWVDAQVTADCLRQMLVTVGVMYESKREDDRAVAEYIQGNIYHEQMTFDVAIDMVKRYKYQSLGYLQSAVLLSHILLKSVERFSKDKQIMFVRRRKKSKPKKKTTPSATDTNADETTAGSTGTDAPADENVNGADMEQEEEEEDDDGEEDEEREEYREQMFNFNAFEARYASDEVIRVYCTLLEQYQTLEPEILHCITSLFHRLMVKRQVDYIFWKLPILELFNRILIESRLMHHTPNFSQLLQFIRYCTRQFFKRAEEYPLIFIEVLFKHAKSRAPQA